MLVFAAVLAPNCFRLQNLDLMKQVSQSWVFLSFSVNEKAYYKDMLSGDLRDKFSTRFEEDLEEELNYDVLIVVGSDAKI